MSLTIKADLTILERLYLETSFRLVNTQFKFKATEKWIFRSRGYYNDSSYNGSKDNTFYGFGI